MAITEEELRVAYLTPPMLQYFRKKLPEVAEDELLIRIEETLKFMAIARYCTGPIPVVIEIDEIWHYWILQTQEYEQLCQALPGGEFIHHSSNAYLEFSDPNVGTTLNLRADVEMLAAYAANYGPFTERRVKYWHLAAYLIEKRHWSVDELNHWLTAGPSTEACVGTLALSD
jgi:hypothetical protein